MRKKKFSEQPVGGEEEINSWGSNGKACKKGEREKKKDDIEGKYLQCLSNRGKR